MLHESGDVYVDQDQRELVLIRNVSNKCVIQYLDTSSYSIIDTDTLASYDHVRTDEELIRGKRNEISPDTFSYREGVLRVKGGVWVGYYVHLPPPIRDKARRDFLSSLNPDMFPTEDYFRVYEKEQEVVFYTYYLVEAPDDMKAFVLSWLGDIHGGCDFIETEGPHSLWFK